MLAVIQEKEALITNQDKVCLDQSENLKRGTDNESPVTTFNACIVPYLDVM